MKLFARLSSNQRLATVAFVLAAGALFSKPMRGAAARIDPQELAMIAQRGADRIAPTTLADWIIQARADYRLIDVRDQLQYAAYHVPTAENIPLLSLAAAEIAPTEKVILYADDGARSSQAWFVLRARGIRDVFMVTDGIDGWKHTVLFPILAETMEPETVARLRAVSSHFGGTPLSASASAPGVPAGALANTEVETPPSPPPPVTNSTPAKPKKKEGC